MWTISKVFIEFDTIFFYVFGVFGLKACEIVASWPGIEPKSSALEGKVLTTGLPGKSLELFLCLYLW